MTSSRSGTPASSTSRYPQVSWRSSPAHRMPCRSSVRMRRRASSSISSQQTCLPKRSCLSAAPHLASEERRDVEHVERGQVRAHHVATELRTQVRAEEPGAFTNDVVEDEEAVDLGQKCDLVDAHREHAAVRVEERQERWLDQRVRAVCEPCAVTGRARDARQKVEVEESRLDPKPVVVPSAVEAEASIGSGFDGEVAEVPVDEDGDLRPLVVADFDKSFEESMGVLPEHGDRFRREVEVARRERAFEQIEKVNRIALDGLRRARQQRGYVRAR